MQKRKKGEGTPAPGKYENLHTPTRFPAASRKGPGYSTPKAQPSLEETQPMQRTRGFQDQQRDLGDVVKLFIPSTSPSPASVCKPVFPSGLILSSIEYVSFLVS
jgi:hypothetical protein